MRKKRIGWDETDGDRKIKKKRIVLLEIEKVTTLERNLYRCGIDV
jgi:hypothetical protein